jgi:catechol 2,3-dioxygenase-like lactoylglutathione lyase family enzyme
MKKVPTDFRRVTLLVNHMDPALTIYRDILGMEVYYDQEIDVALPGFPADQPKSRARLVILKCNDQYIGMLGIMQLLDSPLPDPEPRPVPNHIRAGEAVFVMQHDNVEVAYEKLKDIEGVQILAEPHVTEFPRPDGGVFRVEGFRFFDPNGYFIDLNQTVE